MQVKKFEAPTVTEALQIVKEELGPNAVILSTKDVKGQRGVVTSVQVTAVTSEGGLEGRPVVETEVDRESSKNLFPQERGLQINEFVDDLQENLAKHKELTKTPYIQISEEEKRPEDFANGIQRAVQQAHAASTQFEGDGDPEAKRDLIGAVDDKKLTSLQNEITYLKSMISDCRKVPQNFLSLHPGAEWGIPYEMSHIFDKLTRAGVNKEIVVEISKKAQEVMSPQRMKNHHLVEAWVVKYLLDSIVCTVDRFEGRYHIFVGGGGHGKTSTLVKWASQMVVSGRKSIGIVAADCTKIGAVEQLRTYTKILNIAFACVEDPAEGFFVNREFSQLDCILVDFPGISFQNDEDVMKRLPPQVRDRKVHYVQSILSREAEIDRAMRSFSQLGIDDIIFTRLDESVQHGIILNIQKKYGLPLHSFGIGPNLPEDLEPATRERVVDLIFKLTKIKGKEVDNEPEL